MKYSSVINKLRSVLVGALSTLVIVGCSTAGYKPAVQYTMEPPLNFDALDNEKYSHIQENQFLKAMSEPVSTFSIDVDTASYSNVRSLINGGTMPPKDSVRIEELVNYFSYVYPQPQPGQPFSISTEIASAPWNKEHKLLQIGLKGRDINWENIPPTNLVFLIDVSGSMYGRLPMVKSALKLLIKQLRPQDSIAIVVYAGAAGLVLPPTSGSDKATVFNALDTLQAGGSTAGGAGIHLAYTVAKEHFVADGNNRVVLATDGDFNVGASSESDLLRLIEQKRQLGIYLTVLGFGRGNINDTTMELLADKGNGNFAYIDSMLEAKKVLVNEMSGTLFTIAKDVKIRVEFNPAKVQAYRLIGYENRLLNKADFADDKKDAGEIGAGHTVTALYEIIPAKSQSADGDYGKYVETTISPSALSSGEIVTVKLRYKQPNATTSQLLVHPVIDSNTPIANASENLRFASAVAEFGLLLRQSEHKGNANYSQVIARAKSAIDTDANGYRSEFVRLVGTVEAITN